MKGVYEGALDREENKQKTETPSQTKRLFRSQDGQQLASGNQACMCDPVQTDDTDV